MPTRTATVSPNRSYQDGKNLVVTITAPEFATVATVVATATLNDGTYSKTWTIIDQKQVMGKSSITVVLKADDPRPNGTGTIQLVTRPAVTVVTIPVEVVDIDPCATVVVPSPVPPVTPPPPPPPSTSP